MTLMRTTQVNPAEEPFAVLSGIASYTFIVVSLYLSSVTKLGDCFPQALTMTSKQQATKTKHNYPYFTLSLIFCLNLCIPLISNNPPLWKIHPTRNKVLVVYVCTIVPNVCVAVCSALAFLADPWLSHSAILSIAQPRRKRAESS